MDPVKRSVKVLKQLQLKNGAIISTLKNDAYPFVYPRDGTIITKAFNQSGEAKRSKKFYYFLKPIINSMHETFQRYTEDGLPLVSKKHEHDNDGLVIDGIWDTFQHTGDTKFLEDMWSLVVRLTKRIKEHTNKKTGLIYTERSIHEFFRLEEGFEIWANSVSCKGLYSASEIAKSLNRKNLARKWYIQANTLKKHIMRDLFDKKKKIFIKVLKTDGTKILSPDITQLAPFYFELVDSDEILKKMTKWFNKTLWYKELGGFLRFRKFEFVKDWHWYTGGFGPFPQFTLWMASFYHKLNDDINCIKCTEWVEKIFTKEGYLPEHVALQKEYDEWKKNEYEFSERILLGMKRSDKIKKKNIRYWATPLGWANAEYILLNKKITSA